MPTKVCGLAFPGNKFASAFGATDPHHGAQRSFAFGVMRRFIISSLVISLLSEGIEVTFVSRADTRCYPRAG